MIRRFVLLAALMSAGCSASSPTAAPPAAHSSLSIDAIAGTWSATAPVNFIQLTLASKSSELGAIGARLTFSGIAWEGSGRIDGDSLVATVTAGVNATDSQRLVVRLANSQTLTATLGTGQPMTFVRE